MAAGFFEESDVISRAPISTVPKCGACGLFKVCKSPKMEPSGEGKKRILILGEAPTTDEDKKGIQFVGKTGTLLNDTLEELGIDMRRDCVLTNSLVCRPPDNTTPSSDQIDYCRPNLVKAVETFDPIVIIPLGNAAIQSLLRWVWKEGVDSISTFAGFTIPSQKLNAWICPTFHPSYVARARDNEERNEKVIRRFWKQHLQAACSKTKRPWKTVPNYESQVECMFDEDEIVEGIRQFTKAGEAAAFDYETNMIKPDEAFSAILSCSISDGRRTIAFPWWGKRIKDAMQAFLKSDCPKIASNLKFEERWTLRMFGHGVTNWYWDTMLAAHWIDNRPSITSIKFQAFVMLGAESYEEAVKPLMKPKRGGKVNQLKDEVSIKKLLLYNGLDSLLEYKVAMKQIQQTGYEQ